MIKEKKINHMAQAILETSEDMFKGGIMSEVDFKKITMRHLGIKKEKVTITPLIKGNEIRALREEAHMSQAVFARYLNLTAGYLSQLEREAKRPTGAVLALLNVIRRKGIEVML